MSLLSLCVLLLLSRSQRYLLYGGGNKGTPIGGRSCLYLLDLSPTLRLQGIKEGPGFEAEALLQISPTRDCVGSRTCAKVINLSLEELGKEGNRVGIIEEGERERLSALSAEERGLS